MLKKTRIYSILFNKCPKCHEGRFFKHNSAFWPLKEFDKMNRSCSHCGESFMPEPGFYYGAMYLSYAYFVALILVLTPVCLTYLSMDITEFVASLVVLFIILTPVFFRLARRAWLTIFVKYEPEKDREVSAGQMQ